MKIAIFGATGTVGYEVVTQALEKGYDVTAFVRHPDKFPPLIHQKLRLHKGDVLKLEEVERAVAGHDAVVCTLGDGRYGKVRAKGTSHIIQAMDKAKVTRLICLSSLGVGDSYGNLNFVWKHIMFGLLLRSAFNDHKLQENHIWNSRLKFTIVRPSALTKGTITNDFKIGFDGKYKNLHLKISKEDVANFLLCQLHTEEYLMKAVSISN